MCEFRQAPIGRFDPIHKGDGSSAPNCVIRVHVRCLPDFCDEAIAVVIVDRESDAPLTEPKPVECDGQDHTYDLRMSISGPLQFRSVVMRFRCCGQEKDGRQDAIWVRCE